MCVNEAQIKCLTHTTSGDLLGLKLNYRLKITIINLHQAAILQLMIFAQVLRVGLNCFKTLEISARIASSSFVCLD